MGNTNLRGFYFVAVALVAACGWSGKSQAEDLSPACTDPGYRQSDYLLGKWDVYFEGKKIGDVSFEKAVGGCAITELWRAGHDATGTLPNEWIAISAYSPKTKTAEYFVALNDGTFHTLKGVSQGPNSSCLMEKRTWKPSDGPDTHYCVSLQPDGSVLDADRVSTDGKTWTTREEFIFRKQK